jgi:hypothetical protein
VHLFAGDGEIRRPKVIPWLLRREIRRGRVIPGLPEREWKARDLEMNRRRGELRLLPIEKTRGFVILRPFGSELEELHREKRGGRVRGDFLRVGRNSLRD